MGSSLVQPNCPWTSEPLEKDSANAKIKSIPFGFQILSPHLQGKVIHVSIDTAAVFCVSKQGAHSRQLCRETVALCDWCIQHHIYHIALHLMGKVNRLADQLSRDRSEQYKWSQNLSSRWEILSLELSRHRLICKQMQFIMPKVLFKNWSRNPIHIRCISAWLGNRSPLYPFPHLFSLKES